MKKANARKQIADFRNIVFSAVLPALFRQPLPQLQILLSKGPHTHSKELPPIRCIVRPIDEGVNVMVIEDGKPSAYKRNSLYDPKVDVRVHDIHGIVVDAIKLGTRGH